MLLLYALVWESLGHYGWQEEQTALADGIEGLWSHEREKNRHGKQ
jgi:hypothetical protein